MDFLGANLHPFSLSESPGRVVAVVALAQRHLKIVESGPRRFELDGLIPAIVAGDQAALARFREATSGLLFGLLLLILGDTATAEVVLLEVYAEVSKQAARFEKNHESILNWLITMTHRRALEHLCGTVGAQEFAMAVGLAAAQRAGVGRGFGISKAAHRRLIGATLDSLSPEERKIIELAYFCRLSNSAIAADLRQSPEKVKLGLEYGLSRLYHLFKQGTPAEGFTEPRPGQ